MKALSFLQRPFPLELGFKKSLKMAFGFGLFVCGFLQFFQPFGLSNVYGNLWQVTTVFGLICFGIMILVQALFPAVCKNFYKEEKWTVGRSILHTLLIILAISLGNFAWIIHLGFYEFTWFTFFQFMAYTLVIGAFPVSITTLITQNRLSKKYTKESNSFKANYHEHPQNQIAQVVLKDEENRNAIKIAAQRIYFIKSADNYVEIHAEENGVMTRTLLRNSMKSIENQLPENAEFFRCHRSFIANLSKVQKVEGNARGLKLVMRQNTVSIPVSRSLNQVIKDALKAL